jgi:hypothetical protein
LCSQFSFFLIIVILSEFGGAIWVLTSRADFEEEMEIAMREALSSYTKDKDVADKWASLQKEVIIPSS